jgi:NADPH-dependent 2,4-dienoyl-CoA reductase/sulfur reductase-like enzyme
MLGDYLSKVDSPYLGMLFSSCIKLVDYEMASTGLSEKMCIENNIKYKVKVIKDFDRASYYPPQSQVITKLVYDPESLVILGAQMVGKNGVVQRINTLSLAIYKKVTTSELGYIDFAYAPPFSRTWDLLNVVGNVSK